MCGFLGVAGRPIAKEPFVQTLTELANRGPDDVGIYRDGYVLLGLQHLAILDWSQSGHQTKGDEQDGLISSAAEIAMWQHGRLVVTREPHSWVGRVWE